MAPSHHGSCSLGRTPSPAWPSDTVCMNTGLVHTMNGLVPKPSDTVYMNTGLVHTVNGLVPKPSDTVYMNTGLVHTVNGLVPKPSDTVYMNTGLVHTVNGLVPKPSDTVYMNTGLVHTLNGLVPKPLLPPLLDHFQSANTCTSYSRLPNVIARVSLAKSDSHTKRVWLHETMYESRSRHLHVCPTVKHLPLSLVPRPFLYGRGEKGEGRKDLGTKLLATGIE